MDYPFIIDIEDERCILLLKKLKEREFNAKERKSGDTYVNCAIVFSPSKVVCESDVLNVSGGIIICGRADDGAVAYMKEHGIRRFNMLEDERFVVLNSIPTALGCIELLIRESKKCINEVQALVLGYGRVGKTLCKYFCGLDVETSVYSVDEKEFALAEVFASKAISDFSCIAKYGLIINTIPAKILDESVLNSVDKGAVVCDLASGDYVDIESLKSRDINAFKAPGLPGKTAPESAAEYMLEYVLKVTDLRK